MIVRATADNQNQLRFTAEHQPALAQRRRVGRREWAAQFSDTEQVQWVRLPVTCTRRGLQSTRRTRKSRTKERRKERKRSDETLIWNRHFIASVNRKITKRHRAESVGIQRSSTGKTVPLDAKKACGGME
jgi:hypothetical protein